MGILDQFVNRTHIILLTSKEFITLTSEYDRLQEIADVKFREVMQYIRDHPKEFAMVKNIGEEDAKGKEETNSKGT